ncbi:MAG: hypothetical protein K0B16_09475 [Burkholderiaceae bacterium]|nr:hypothetical protein [Burkholderiaceae bacterium]
MSFGVISSWTSSAPMSEELKSEARNKYAPGVKALGASQVHFIQTSDSTFQVVTIYPDEGVANSARDKQAALHAQAAGELPVKMVGEYRGEVFAAA